MEHFNNKERKNLNKAIAVLDADLEQFKKVMKYIDLHVNMTFNEQTFSELKEVCKVILNNVPFMISFVESTYITRARKNTKELFSKKQDISCNTNIERIEAGRFNLEKQSVFYGCLPTYHPNGERINYRNQCPMFEVCKEITTHEGLTFPIFFTLGFWKVTKPLAVMNLCYDEDHLDSNSALDRPVKAFIENLQASCPKDVFDFIMNVWRYFSGLSRKWDEANHRNYYYILTAFFAAFEESHQETYHTSCTGIIYPSAMTQAKGLNIVLNPKSVDEHLELTHVQMYTLRSRGLPYDYEPLTKAVQVLDDGFTFEPKFISEYNMFMHNWDEVNWSLFNN